MHPFRPLVCCVLLVLCGPTAGAATAGGEVAAVADRELASLLALYQDLHAHPELSRFEVRTSGVLAGELRRAGFEVTEQVGRYANGTRAYGVVAILRNGAGPTLLVRSDMDALPVEEKTGLAYASTVRMKNDAGIDMPVMHACGHDVHVTSLIGTARVMARLKNRWHGTLMLLGQPAEEVVDGARAMVRDDLYTHFPRPDMLIALHDTNDLPAGKVGVTPGFAMATSTSLDILVRGVGAHGSRPSDGKDPIVLAANIILELQTIVSREISPFDPAVVTVGTIHGGTKRNIIPDQVLLEVNMRSYREEVRLHLVESVRRIAHGAALAAGIPEDRLPLVTVHEEEAVPALYNDPTLGTRLMASFARALGADNVEQTAPIMASEDFGELGLKGQIPSVMFWLGAADPEALRASRAARKPLPGLHSPLFTPAAEPALRTGVIATASAAIDLLQPGRR